MAGRALRALVATTVASAVLLAPAQGIQARAAASEDPDWPCIQRKVPRISAGMVWAGPPIEALDTDWRADADVSQIAGMIAARSTDLEDAKAAIQEFAAGLGSDKDRKLTLLFAGVLGLINAERDAIMKGIQGYARRQKALAEKIERDGAELNRIPAEATEAERARREDFMEQIVWDTRIFEERERSLTYVCEQPVLLEQRIFALAREIMTYLD